MTRGTQTPFALIFADLTILLLTFLIFLNALAKPDVDRSKEAINSVGEQFSASSDEAQHDKLRLKDSIQPAVVERFTAMSNTTRYSSLVSSAEHGEIEFFEGDNSFTFLIPADLLFTASDEIAVRFLPLLRDIAEDTSKSRRQIQVDVRHTTIVEDSKQQWNRSMVQAMALLRFFIDHQIPPQHLHSVAHAGFPASLENADAGVEREQKLVKLTIRPVSEEVADA